MSQQNSDQATREITMRITVPAEVFEAITPAFQQLFEWLTEHGGAVRIETDGETIELGGPPPPAPC